MKIKRVKKTAAQILSVPETNSEILFSYETPVALRDIGGDVYYRENHFYSVTTSKHVNQFCLEDAFPVESKHWKELLGKFTNNNPLIVD